jgi:hypothetical protein
MLFFKLIISVQRNLHFQEHLHFSNMPVFLKSSSQEKAQQAYFALQMALMKEERSGRVVLALRRDFLKQHYNIEWLRDEFTVQTSGKDRTYKDDVVQLICQTADDRKEFQRLLDLSGITTETPTTRSRSRSMPEASLPLAVKKEVEAVKREASRMARTAAAPSSSTSSMSVASSKKSEMDGLVKVYNETKKRLADGIAKRNETLAKLSALSIKHEDEDDDEAESHPTTLRAF